MSSTIDLTEELADCLPPDVLDHWVPIRGKSVFHLFVFNKYPANKIKYTIPSKLAPLLHEEIIMDFDYTTLLQLGPPIDSSVTEAYQTAIKSARHQVHSVTLVPHPEHGDP